MDLFWFCFFLWHSSHSHFFRDTRLSAIDCRSFRDFDADQRNAIDHHEVDSKFDRMVGRPANVHSPDLGLRDHWVRSFSFLCLKEGFHETSKNGSED